MNKDLVASLGLDALGISWPPAMLPQTQPRAEDWTVREQSPGLRPGGGQDTHPG